MKRYILFLMCFFTVLCTIFSCTLPTSNTGNSDSSKTEKEDDGRDTDEDENEDNDSSDKDSDKDDENGSSDSKDDDENDENGSSDNKDNSGSGDNSSGSEETKSTCTVTFDTQGGSKVKPKEVKKGSTVSEPYAVPSKKGYDFIGWYYGDEKWSFLTDKVYEDITITARYKTYDYYITYDLSGGECAEQLPDVYNIESGVIVLPELTRGRSVFEGWYMNGEKISEIRSDMKGDITLVAKFYDSIPIIIGGATPASEATIYATNGDNKVTVEFKTEIKENLTSVLRVEVPENWHFIKIAQGTKTSYVMAKDIDGVNYAEIKMTSNSHNSALTPIGYKDDLTVESDYGIRLSDGTLVDVNYYPGFTRKAVTFTIDDGVVAMDTKLLEILKPAGIMGTFNIVDPARNNGLTLEKYLALYEGYEVANHHILHTTPYRDAFDYSAVEFSDSFLPPAEEQDKSVIYKNAGKVDGEYVDGFYYIHWSVYHPGTSAGWHPLATDETYTKYLELTTDKIEAVFGKGSVVGFAYPHGVLSTNIKNYIKDAGYLYARKTGNLKGTTGFALPSDRYAWTYNADHNCLLEVMAEYEAYADDGQLKMFALGVHAKDFETYNKWEDLKTFADLYGNRAEDFWYASNREIFEYEDAVKALTITNESIVNSSELDLFVAINGVKTLIPAKSQYLFK